MLRTAFLAGLGSGVCGPGNDNEMVVRVAGVCAYEWGRAVRIPSVVGWLSLEKWSICVFRLQSDWVETGSVVITRREQLVWQTGK